MDRKQLKAQSKNLIRTAQPKPVVTAIIYLLIISVLGFLSYKLVGGSSFELQSVYEQFGIGYDVGFGTGAYDSFDPDQFAYAIEQALPTPGAALLNLAVGIVSLVIGAGFTIYCLRTVRGMETSYWNLFDAFGMFFRVIWLYILEGIFVFLWSLLFIVPGIIAAYRYRFAYYNLCENPDMGVMEALNMSKAQTAGFKWQLFVLDLSFIGWNILVGLTLGILDIWVAPYIAQSNIAFFQEIKKIKGVGFFPPRPEDDDQFRPHDPFGEDNW